MKNSKTKIIVASLAGVILSAVSPVLAQFHQGTSVTMGNSPIFTITTSYGGYSASHRAWLAQDALDNALVVANNKGPDAVAVGRMNGAWIVTLDGRKVATASSEAEANEWSSAIKGFLSDSARTSSYLATLTGKNPVGANIALIERKLYAPAGLAMKVRLVKDLNPDQLQSVELVEAVVVEDVPMGGFVIPANSTVIGDVTKDESGAYAIRFTSLRTPTGTEVPINVAINSEFLVTSESPHPVCTYVIPSGEANGMPNIIGRVPASVGIGTRSGTAGLRTALLLSPGDPVILSSQPMTLLFQEATPVAVINRTAM
ncbi:MAG: hypothetical protein K2X77_15350 [Candidatus Obscuribacterales bacterium]|jgi:hypothetical protein|nr:hypothetical protein [Candidatus Obscuribacterales bacterium]